jgi:DNA-directed RNA polymerase subunit M/transcription elongation factor TFIIS
MESYILLSERRATSIALESYFKKKHCPAIEEGIYNYAIQYCKSHNIEEREIPSIYHDSLKNIIYNCKPDNNTIIRLKNEMDSCKFDPYNLAFLRPEELDEDNWLTIRLRKNTTEDVLKNLPTIKRNPCKVCKGTEYFYYRLQTRSADEPMTMFFICKNCDRTTRENN